MNYKIKGVLLGIVFLIAFTLIVAPMTNQLKDKIHSLNCDYFCSVKELAIAYNHPLFLILLASCWFLGSTIARLSYLITKKDDPNPKIGRASCRERV